MPSRIQFYCEEKAKELRPCPFCGGTAHFTLFLGRRIITCEQCFGCMMPDVFEDDLIDEKYIIDHEARAWNRRAKEEKR